MSVDGNYLTAAQAAKMLDVSLQTLYAYVSRKGVRSVPIAGSRRRRYWKSDIERLREKRLPPPPPGPSPLAHASKITLVTDSEIFYRGRNALELAAADSFESVAALLWGCKEEDAFGKDPPRIPAIARKMDALLAEESELNRATALFTLLEQANPKAYDLSPAGMARTGADILRCLAAITVHARDPSAEPIHSFVARKQALPPPLADLVRRMLILSADHAFEPGTVAVRAVASTGVTPWRSLIAGFSVTLGRPARLGSYDAIYRFVVELADSGSPHAMMVSRIRDGELIPGFDSHSTPVHPGGDPRAQAAFAACRAAMAKDAAFERLAQAAAVAREVRGLEPSFALMCVFVGWKIGLRRHDSLFHLGRAAGWLAHAMEQYQAGEAARQKEWYQGPLPV
jgi:citrate synthase